MSPLKILEWLSFKWSKLPNEYEKFSFERNVINRKTFFHTNLLVITPLNKFCIEFINILNFAYTIDEALYKLSLILDTLFWHLSIILPYYTIPPTDFLFLWESIKMHQKLLALAVAKRKNKVHQGWHVPTKMYVCAYNGYSAFLVKCIFFGSITKIRNWLHCTGRIPIAKLYFLQAISFEILLLWELLNKSHTTAVAKRTETQGTIQRVPKIFQIISF